jgi:hypothetical protein
VSNSTILKSGNLIVRNHKSMKDQMKNPEG